MINIKRKNNSLKIGSILLIIGILLVYLYINGFLVHNFGLLKDFLIMGLGIVLVWMGGIIFIFNFLEWIGKSVGLK